VICHFEAIVVQSMLTDGRTWWIATAQPADLTKLQEILASVGIQAERQPYCPDEGTDVDQSV
jgi:hypothetical protein